MTPDFRTGVSLAEEELLHLLQEECAETIQAASKVLRHGWASRNPDDMEPARTNREHLEYEAGHVRAALTLLARRDCVRIEPLLDSMRRKLQTVRPYLHHQQDLPFDTPVTLVVDGT